VIWQNSTPPGCHWRLASIRDGGPEFTRTYPTVIAMWSLVEARTSPSVHERIGNQYDERIRQRHRLVIQTYKEGQGGFRIPIARDKRIASTG